MLLMKRNRIVTCLAIATLHWSLAQGAPSEPPISPEYSKALRSGDARQLREALDHGAPTNARDAAGTTPLMRAAVYGDLASVRLLIERGADVNATNAAGATALMRASSNYEKTRLLLEHGAKVNTRSALGNTPLMLAARPWNSHKTVSLLLKHGADAKATNDFGATALMAAAAGGDAESVRLLLKYGADPNARPAANQPGFFFGGGRSPLMWAAYHGNNEIAKLLLDAGADVNGEGFTGTPLSQAAWADQTSTARLLIERGAQVNQAHRVWGYTALHWAASTDERNPALANLLLQHGADPNLGGGENVDAFMDVLQTPLMLAKRRGQTPVVNALLHAGATNETPDRVRALPPPARNLPANLDEDTVRLAISQAIPPLQESSLKSKRSFVSHASHQDCTSCHQQYLPMAAISLARKSQVQVDKEAELELVKMVQAGDLKNPEMDWEPLFHPEPVHSKGYALFAEAAEDLPANENTDSWVHHLSVIQGKDGRWYNNLPRPPLQTGDVGATALAVHALQRYGAPGRKAELSKQVERARQWLWAVKPVNTESKVYQLLGLAWAGEPAQKLQPLASALLADQRNDGGWAQLPELKSDAYATGQAVYALRVAGGIPISHPGVERGRRFLVQTQLDDGTWYVRRRAFPFQPTMDSGFPYGRDSWISASATSWAVMALSLPEANKTLASQ
jgi:ankyrin repeat protein